MRRSIAFILAGVLCVALALFVEPADLLPPLGKSWFFSPGLLGELRVALATFGVIVAAAPWWLEWLRREPGPIEGPASAETRRLSRPIDALFVLALVATAGALWWRDDPMSKDTKYYLGEALDIAERGGVANLLERCLDGSWREDNRHPLYLALLAPWASASNAFLSAARVISLIGAVLTMCVCLRACRRRGGELAALAGGTLLITNATFVEHSVLVACESWWTACAVAAFDMATREGTRRPWARWSVVGILLGFSFLAKGTGTLLLMSTAAWILFVERRRAWRALAPLAIGFVVSAWPLLVRNRLRFGDPFWNLNSRRLFWLDNFQQYYQPDLVENASAGHYFATHSVGDVVARLGMGSIKQLVHLLECSAPFVPSVAFGAPLFVLLIFALARWSDRRARSFLLIVGAAWLLSFAWYAPVASDRRFLAVLLPIALPSLASWTLRLRGRERVLVRAATLSITAAVLVFEIHGAWRIASSQPFVSAPWNDDVKSYLRKRSLVDPDAIYLLGPSSNLGFDWDRSVSATRRARPHDEDELRTWQSQSLGDRYRFVVVEAHAGATRWADGWVEFTDSGEVRARVVPAEWELVATFPLEAPRVAVFERK